MNCKKCGLPIHQELVKTRHVKSHWEWLHDDTNEAWCVIDGYARNLHFAEPLVIVEEANIRVEKVTTT